MFLTEFWIDQLISNQERILWVVNSARVEAARENRCSSALLKHLYVSKAGLSLLFAIFVCGVCLFVFSFYFFFLLKYRYQREEVMNWPIHDCDYWTVLFKEKSLRKSRVIGCWLTIENHITRHSSSKSVVFCSAPKGYCSFASSSLTLCTVPGEVQGRRKENNGEIKKVRYIKSKPLITQGFQPSCARNVLY